MKVIWLIGLVILTALLQVSFLPAARPLGMVPNLALIVVLYAAVELTASETLAMAMGLGLLLDIASGADFGLRTAYLAFAGLLIVIIRRTGADFTRLSMLFAALISAGVLWNVGLLASLVVAHATIQWHEALRRVVLETGLNVVLALLLHMPLRWFLAMASDRPVGVVVRGV